MIIMTMNVNGFQDAMLAMRNPYKSWENGDTDGRNVGKRDMELSKKLASAGPEHAKHLRMITCTAQIIAPRFWWQQMDTYRIGVEKVSTSTMHTIMKESLRQEDFSDPLLPGVLDMLNGLIAQYGNEPDKDVKAKLFRKVVANLPQSYMQERTVMFSYAALRNIYRQRKGHKLEEWAIFLKFVENLPNSWMITE